VPIYEYVCQECGAKFEKFVRSMSSTAPIACPECQSEKVEKAISLFGMSQSGNLGSAAVSAASCATGST
jgi:putative FmdB family regulatory protein